MGLSKFNLYFSVSYNIYQNKEGLTMKNTFTQMEMKEAFLFIELARNLIFTKNRGLGWNTVAEWVSINMLEALSSIPELVYKQKNNSSFTKNNLFLAWVDHLVI